MAKMPRIDYFFDRELGFDFSVGPSRGFRTWIAVWFTRRCDYGIAIGNREWRRSL